jgi:hypothetical protein
MTLEARLHALADDAFPPTPDLAARWALEPAPDVGSAAHRWRRRRTLAIAAALVLAPAATVAAVELWGPAHVRVRTGAILPPGPTDPQAGGKEVQTLSQAADRAGFEPFTPPFLDADPRNIRVRSGVVTFEQGDATVTEIHGSLFVEKTISTAADAQQVRVDGTEAWFFRGRHDVLVETADGATVLERRRAGPTLVYERGGIVVRVEGLTAPPTSPAP